MITIGKSLILFVVACYVVGAISDYQSAKLFDADYVRVTPEMIPTLRSNEILLGALTTVFVVIAGAALSLPLTVTSLLSLLTGLTFAAWQTIVDAGGLIEAVGSAVGFVSTYGVGWLAVVLLAVTATKSLEVRKRREENDT